MRNSNVGIDIVEVSRFKQFTRRSRSAFLKRVFFATEVKYCFARGAPAMHLAGIFAAKEAASKALGTAKYPLVELEIRHTRSGAPEVWYKGRKLRVRVSITHTETVAAAVALH